MVATVFTAPWIHKAGYKTYAEEQFLSSEENNNTD